MNPARRKFLQLAAGAATAPFGSQPLLAIDYPTRPVRLIVGFAAGGAADVSARLVAQSLSTRLGRQFIVENKTGAGGRSPRRKSLNRLRTATRSSTVLLRTQAQRSIPSWISISFAILHLSQGPCACHYC